MPTQIEWTDETWNPVTGCVKVSAGCKNCYAETFSERFRGTIMPSGKLHPFYSGFDPQIRPERLQQPLSWRTPKKVFVNSMSDLFGDFVTDRYLDQVFEIMRETPQHTYQVLTKRSERLADWSRKRRWLEQAKHIWLGVSVENRRYGLPRIRDLQHSTAAVRFLSIEPLLEDLGTFSLQKIDWVIVGGESGPRARPIEEAWVRNIRDRCVEEDISFFFKQWGGTRKKWTGRVLEGRTWDEYPSP